MATARTGIWFIGARGGVASSAALGLIGLQQQLTDTVGLVSELPQFARLPMVDWNALVIGGHDIRDAPLVDAVERLHRESRVFDAALVEAARGELQAIDARIRPGTLFRCGTTIESLAEASMVSLSHESPRDAVERLQADLKHFKTAEHLDQVIVVNVASTEPATNYVDLPPKWRDLERLLDEGAACPLSASSLYAIAALDLAMPYINFTPSPGATPAAIGELAIQRKTCHAGQDGKTGETLLKAVLAPMFAARNLQVMSWVGHNIFGNMDGQVLDDPVNKSAKIQGKDQLLGHILGYDPQTLVTIEYIRSMGDWKTAWDHIHFRGFLGTPMTMQFTWQGCDSLLAAPLVLDLVRFVELSHRRGETGLLAHLGSFFKRPLGLDNHAFDHQSALLAAWAAAQSNSAGA
ncbi:MAG: inositol-3-phosphate synthase [Pirellulales bacterium]